MDKARWAKIRELFTQVADKSPSHRADYLDMVCEDDDELRRELEELLAAHDELTATTGVSHNRTFGARAAPTAVGDYIIERELGAGGMGVVYQALHPRHGRVALKLLPRYIIADPVAEQRFRREAEVLAALSHPALCRLHDWFVTEQYAGLAMEVVSGRELGTVLEQNGPLPFARSLAVASTLAAALAQTHERGIVHRDVKPANVLLSDDGAARLVDFGIAKFADHKLTATGQILGTPAYMSPEQWRGDAMDARSDLWALGCLLYEMLTGRAPFGGADITAVAAAVLSEEPAPLPARSIDGLSLLGVDTVVMRLLAKEAEARPASCVELARALDALHPILAR